MCKKEKKKRRNRINKRKAKEAKVRWGKGIGELTERAENRSNLFRGERKKGD